MYDFPPKKLSVTVVFTDSKTAKRFVGVIIATACFSPLNYNVASLPCYKTPPHFLYTVRVFFAVTFFFLFCYSAFQPLTC